MNSPRFQFVSNGMRVIADIKLKIMQAVENLYEFDTSQAHESIGRNAHHAQALLTKMTFVYRVRLIASMLSAN